MVIDFKNYGDDPQNKKYWNDLRKHQNNVKTYLLLILFFISSVCFAYLIGDLALHLKTMEARDTRWNIKAPGNWCVTNNVMFKAREDGSCHIEDIK